MDRPPLSRLSHTGVEPISGSGSPVLLVLVIVAVVTLMFVTGVRDAMKEKSVYHLRLDGKFGTLPDVFASTGKEKMQAIVTSIEQSSVIRVTEPLHHTPPKRARRTRPFDQDKSTRLRMLPSTLAFTGLPFGLPIFTGIPPLGAASGEPPRSTRVPGNRSSL